jgi:hypothetical protein
LSRFFSFVALFDKGPQESPTLLSNQLVNEENEKTTQKQQSFREGLCLKKMA